MKVLLTAPPRTGKSTLMRRTVHVLEEKHGVNCRGLLSEEILDSFGSRVGFCAVLEDGRKEVFMTKEAEDIVSSKQNSNIDKNGPKVGNYRVNLSIIEKAVAPELQRISDTTSCDDLIYIDEIGRAQAFSSEFLRVTQKIFFETQCCVLASIVHNDESWSLPFKHFDKSWIVEVTCENRDYLPQILESMFVHQTTVAYLKQDVQDACKKILSELIELKMWIASRKLFSNTLKYLIEERVSVSKGNSRIFEIKGDTDNHSVFCDNQAFDYFANKIISVKNDDQLRSFLGKEHYKCDCPLYNGTGPFRGKSQLCSHILSIVLYLLGNNGD